MKRNNSPFYQFYNTRSNMEDCVNRLALFPDTDSINLEQKELDSAIALLEFCKEYITECERLGVD